MFININRYWRCYGCNTLNLEVNVIKYLGKASKEEQIVFLNSLLMGKVNVSISAYILFLYNKIIENKKEIKIIDEIINFVKNKNGWWKF